MAKVELYCWNPMLPAIPGRIGRRLPLTRALNNFGDLLGPIVVEAMLRQRPGRAVAARDAQLLSVGSVIQQASPGAVVWGSGINGRRFPDPALAATLDFRAVRGPRTRAHLVDLGIEVPPIYGDPALLLGMLRPDLTGRASTRAVTVVPNLHDVRTQAATDGTLHPQSKLAHVLETISTSALVVGSSLHAVIVAEALGIPARLVHSATEPPFKYRDYYEGTGRPDYEPARSAKEAIEMGGEQPPQWSPEPLMRAFPYDLWPVA
jgi:pyruvyltransferase